MTTEPPATPALEPSPNPPAAEAPRQGPGRIIRLARERAGLSVEELAAQIKLARATLEALERDDFTTLNEPVYVRGYYRKCAKALALSEAELLAAYQQLVKPKSPRPPTKLLLTSGNGFGTSRQGGWRWWGVLAAALGIVLLTGWLLREGPSPHLSDKVSASVPVVAPAALPPSSAGARTSTAAPPAPPAAPPVERKLEESGAGTPTAPLQPVPQPVAPEPAAVASAAAPAPPAVGAQALVLDFKSTSWVRIEDAEGKLLLSGVIQAGAHQMVSGKPPYALFLGNAPGVRVEYGGKPVDLTPYIKDNDTARLTVPAPPPG
ncbi:MAG: helix-turn-helix domain-containing protein [Nevskia sp.]|nr:helix-turn-helix domain-containing protein [Nevskia sp.]